MSDIDRQRLVDEARALCASHGGRLLFLTLFGSRLYGTALEGRSDLDVYGVYMPEPATLALGGFTGTIRRGTGDGATKNDASDTDFLLLPVLSFVGELLPRGAVAATDLLFAAGRPDCVLFRDPVLDHVLDHPLAYLGLADGAAVRGYCLRQARQYGIRGSRLGAFQAALSAARALCPPQGPEKTRLDAILGPLLERCGESGLCRRSPQAQSAALELCGRHYQGSMSVARFLEEASRARERTRHPGIDPDTGLGVDWKALAHAVRAIRQVEELLTTGALRYPLACAAELMAIRQGRLAWREVEPLIVDGLARLERLRSTSPYARAIDPAVSRRGVLACYGLAAGS